MHLESVQPASQRAGKLHGGYLPTLDGWRAIAILLVMMCHGGLFFFSPHGPHPSGRLQTYAARGWVGVDIFFAISGFLICTRLIREQQKTNSINLRSFYIRRAFRILPPYLFYLGFVSALSLAGVIIVQKGEVISALLFVRNYLPAITNRDIGWYTGHFWSLAVEEHFYLLWPTLLLLLRPKRANLAAFGLIIAITLWRTIDLHYKFFFPAAGHIFEHRSDTRLDSLLWGCIFAIAFTTDVGRALIKKWITPTIWLICVAAVIVLATKLTAITYTLRPPLFAAIVVATVVNPQWFIGKILEDARLRWLGRISYSLYIWQQLFLVGDLIPRPLPLGRFQEVPLCFPCIFLCAIASFYLIEQPLVRLGHKLTQKPTQALSQELSQKLAPSQASASAASSSCIAAIASSSVPAPVLSPIA